MPKSTMYSSTMHIRRSGSLIHPQRFLPALIAILAGSAPMARAKQPPDVVASDVNSNTAMGTDAQAGLVSGQFNTAAGAQALQSNQSGSYNTAAGAAALFANTSGYGNTAFGYVALVENTTGGENTACGYEALFLNRTGYYNTATGAFALESNTSGGSNAAFGAYALNSNSTGIYNTGAGFGALYSNTTASSNTALGYDALYSNATGYDNVAAGFEAAFSNTGGYDNTVSGFEALRSNTTGSKNTGDGYSALFSNTTGSSNTAFGLSALHSNTTGSNNVAVGYHAGFDLTTGSNDIDIGNTGVAGEGGVIRVGTAGTQTSAYVAGIVSSKVTGAAVYVTASGQLGVLASSERYKTAIAPLASNADKLRRLRPVSFHLKNEPAGEVQYGLIAEEVATVYPELVIRDGNGRIEGVRYDELAPLLLNELQKQQAMLAAQATEFRAIQQRLADLQAAVAGMRGAGDRAAR
jgi:hypothetical protein